MPLEANKASDRSEMKRVRWRFFAAASFGFCVGIFLLWKLLTDSRGTTLAHMIGWVVIPIVLLVCARWMVHCIRRKEDDPSYSELKNFRE